MHRRLASALEDNGGGHGGEAEHDEQHRDFLKAVERAVKRENHAESGEERRLRPDAEKADFRSVRKIGRRLEEYVKQRHSHQNKSRERRRRALHKRCQRRDVVRAVLHAQHDGAREKHRQQHDARDVIADVLPAGPPLSDREIAVKPGHPGLRRHHEYEKHRESARIEHSLNPGACQQEKSRLARRYKIPLVGEGAQPSDERDETHKKRRDRAESVDLQQSLGVLQAVAGDSGPPSAAGEEIKGRRRKLYAGPYTV